MVYNTRSVLVGLMLGAAQLSIASPAQPSVAVDTPEYRSESVAVDTPEYRTASPSVAVDTPEYRTESVAVDTPEYRTASPSVAVDTPEYRTASASVAVDTPVYRTASASVTVDTPEYRTATASTPIATDCVAKCNKAHEECQGKPNANQATCAADYAQCLGYNPYDNGGSFVTPTACSAATSATSSGSKPTGSQSPPVIVNGAGHLSSPGIIGAIGAIGVAALMLI
ncbi:cell wall glycoprotein [Fusarium denticulatum]|uniref:Cell wall glycoprotein n=1 Tax=Fusarium denticulatum TaxID=48507 RepID=A0A8H5T2H6_9HYPO|nr:cell wall glycoprotein [Fusarium denticulatum]